MLTFFNVQLKSINNNTWHLDAAFILHTTLKSHTDAVMTLENGAIQAM